MAATPNYGWVLPDVNADFGAWGGKLNTAITDIDADLKALADRVTAAEDELDGPIDVVGNITGTGNLVIGGTGSVTGDITSGATVRGQSSVLSFPSAVNNERITIGNFNAGTDLTLGAMGLTVVIQPSAVSTSRFAQVQSADTGGLRNLALRAARFFIGTNLTPAFTSDEGVAIEQSVRFQAGDGCVRLGPGGADRTFLEWYARTATPNARSGYAGFGTTGGTVLTLANEIGTMLLSFSGGTLALGAATVSSVPVQAPSFVGNGAALTNIAQGNVVGLTTALADLVSTDAALGSAIATKMTIGASLSADQLTSGTIPAARYGAAFGWTAQSGTTSRAAVPTTISASSLADLQANTQILANNLRTLIADLRDRGVI